MRVVQKYGGSSVADKQCVERVAQRIAQRHRQGDQLVVVLSAQGKTTNHLIDKAHELSGDISRRELDMLLVTGEQQSVALMAMALNNIGCPVVSLNGYQSGIISDDNFGDARIVAIKPERVERELDSGKVVLVTGFQAITQNQEFTTLGRGGSDTSAVALAYVLDADFCEIYTDVDGVYTSDPRLVTSAKKHAVIHYDAMLEMATLGAKVLHNRSVEIAKKYDVKLLIKSSFDESEGTIVTGNYLEKTLISGVVLDENMVTVSVTQVQDEPGIAYKLFSVLAKNQISIDIILQSIGHNNTKDVVFTVAKHHAKRAYDLLMVHRDDFHADAIIVNDQVAKLSVIGAGIETDPMIGAIVFETLYHAGINIDMISTSEIKMSLIIDKQHAVEALNLLHDRLMALEVSL